MRARTSPARFVSCVCEASSAAWVTLEALERGAVEVVRGEREAAGVAADLVQRGEPEVAVERGVLDALRHHRAGGLLPAHDELVEQRRPLALEQHARGADRRAAGSRGAPVVVLDVAGRGLDVRAVDVQRSRRLLERRRAGRARAAARTPARTSSAPPRASPRARPRRTCAARRSARRTARSAAPRRPGRRRAPSRRSRTRSRSCPRPASRAAARPARGSSRPRRARTPRSRSRSRYSRGFGEAVGMVDAQPVDEPVGDELEHLRVRLLEDVGILDAHAARARRCRRSAGTSRSRDPSRRSARAGPGRPRTGSPLGGRHVVRDDVEDRRRGRRRARPQSARNSASPPSSSEMRVGSTTS